MPKNKAKSDGTVISVRYSDVVKVDIKGYAKGYTLLASPERRGAARRPSRGRANVPGGHVRHPRPGPPGDRLRRYRVPSIGADRAPCIVSVVSRSRCKGTDEVRRQMTDKASFSERLSAVRSICQWLPLSGPNVAGTQRRSRYCSC